MKIEIVSGQENIRLNYIFYNLCKINEVNFMRSYKRMENILSAIIMKERCISMAKARAICKCAECGNEFEKTTDKTNRKEADNWEKWAIGNYTQCPQCWGKEQRKIEEETPMYAEIKLEPFSGNGIAIFCGNTMERKDEIKALGYIWDDEPMSGLFGALSMIRPKKCWSKTFKLENIEKIIEEIKALNVEIKNSISDVDIIAARQIAKEKAEKQEKVDSKIAEIEKPICPEVLKGHRWNQKIYGRKGNYSIYPDSVKTEISDSQAEEIKVYLKVKEEYLKKVEEIKNA